MGHISAAQAALVVSVLNFSQQPVAPEDGDDEKSDHNEDMFD